MQTIDIRNALRKAQEPSCITATFPSELKNMSEIGSNECEFAKDRRRNYKIPNPLMVNKNQEWLQIDLISLVYT